MTHQRLGLVYIRGGFDSFSCPDWPDVRADHWGSEPKVFHHYNLRAFITGIWAILAELTTQISLEEKKLRAQPRVGTDGLDA